MSRNRQPVISPALHSPEARFYTAPRIRLAGPQGQPGGQGGASGVDEPPELLSVLEGRAVPYNSSANVGWYAEEFAPGAFAKSISETARDLPLLLFHEQRTFPIGRATGWREERDGLYGEWELDDSEQAQRAADLAQRGMLTGLSVGFSPIRSEWDLAPYETWDPDNPGADGAIDRVRRVEARLLEVSLVSTPAYVEAEVTLVRTAEHRDARAGQHGQIHASPAGRHAGRPVLESWHKWRSTL